MVDAAAVGSKGGKVNEDAEKLKGFLFKIIDEHKFACRKHPNFCDAIIDPTSSKSWADAEYRIKLRNERGPWTADNIMMEEMAEAFAAYWKGDKANALQELAQCRAVILRIMEFVSKEIEVKSPWNDKDR